MKLYILLSFLGFCSSVSAQFPKACSAVNRDCSCKDVSYEICHTPPAAQELHVGSLEECIQNCDLFGSFGQCNYLLFWETGPDENCKLIADTTLEQYLEACRVVAQPLRDAYEDCVSGFLANTCAPVGCEEPTKCHACNVDDACGLYAQTECEKFGSPGETSENIPDFLSCLSLCTIQQQSNPFTYARYDKEQQECICYPDGLRGCQITAVPFGMTLAQVEICDGCLSDADCPAARPICSVLTGRCVECENNADCTGPNPICDMNANICKPDDCSSCVAPTPICDPDTGACLECKVNADCADPKPDCDEVDHVCKPDCTSDNDCEATDYCKCTDGTDDSDVGNHCPGPEGGACVVGCRDLNDPCKTSNNDDGFCTLIHTCDNAGTTLLASLTIGTRDCTGCSSLKAASGATITMTTNSPSNGELSCTTNVLDNPDAADYESNGQAAFGTFDYLKSCLVFGLSVKLTEFQVSWTGAGTWTPEKFILERSGDVWPYCCYNTADLSISNGQTQSFTCEDIGKAC